MDLKEIELIGEDASEHWYYCSKLAAVKAYLSPVRCGSLLDIGAGSGFFARALLAGGWAERATCVDTGYADDWEESVNGRPLRFQRQVEVSDADTVLLMDVLEHVDDDLGFLRDQVDIASSGSRFLITVPAFHLLWSEHDVALGHRRRYTLMSLRGLVREAGLTVVEDSYFFGFVFPVAVMLRWAERLVSSSKRAPKSQLRRHHPIVNRALAALCRVEMPLLKMNQIAGLTAFCLARKNDQKHVKQNICPEAAGAEVNRILGPSLPTGCDCEFCRILRFQAGLAVADGDLSAFGENRSRSRWSP